LKSSCCGISIEGSRYCAKAERQFPSLLRFFQELDPRFQIKASCFEEVARKSDITFFARGPLVAISPEIEALQGFATKERSARGGRQAPLSLLHK